MQSCSFTKLLEVQADLKKVIENIVSKSGKPCGAQKKQTFWEHLQCVIKSNVQDEEKPVNSYNKNAHMFVIHIQL
jgi:hypothetical protein